jgi:hypothetical protein
VRSKYECKVLQLRSIVVVVVVVEKGDVVMERL